MDVNFNELEMDCTNCHLKFYASQLKLHPTRHELMCGNCLAFPERIPSVTVLRDRPLPKKAKPEPVSPVLPPVESSKQATFSHLPPGHAPFKCESCRYVFTRKSNFNGVCPYCSKKSCRVLTPQEFRS